MKITSKMTIYRHVKMPKNHNVAQAVFNPDMVRYAFITGSYKALHHVICKIQSAFGEV